MYNQLQLKRISDFTWGRLAFIVTPSEYREFIRFCQANGALTQPEEIYLSDSPPPIEMGHACVFYRAMPHRTLSWFCPACEADPTDMEKVVFALMHDSADNLYIPMNPDHPTMDFIKARIDGKWGNADKSEIPGRIATIRKQMRVIEEAQNHLMCEVCDIARILGIE